MDFLEKIKALAVRVEKQKGNIITEEACKNAFVMPFLSALGYDVFNPEIVVPEFTADIGIAQQHMSQLYRYFAVTDAHFAILTNGQQYWFYSDLDEPNRMDQRPFFRFDILDYRPSDIAELSKFTHDLFDLDRILTPSRKQYARWSTNA
jgi:hypothetical protein